MPTDQTIDFVVMFLTIGLLVLGLGSVLFGWLRVKLSQIVMSRTEEGTPDTVASSRPQTDRQPLQTAPRVPSRDVMLDMYRLLREYNVPREKARPILKAAGLPLDNNLWTEAQPEAETVTPFVGRRTKAVFHEDDPDLVYQPPN